MGSGITAPTYTNYSISLHHLAIDQMGGNTDKLCNAEVFASYFI